MEERKLSWPERGKLWARLGIRLALLVLALWLLQAVGLPLLSLFAPFVAALITAAILHPPSGGCNGGWACPGNFPPC